MNIFKLFRKKKPLSQYQKYLLITRIETANALVINLSPSWLYDRPAKLNDYMESALILGIELYPEQRN